MHVSLAGKVAVVTGAASGVGLATVQQFLESGIAGVVAVDIADDMPAAVREFQAADSPRLVYVRGDVGRDTTAREFTQAARQHFGRIDILFNNAGIALVKRIHEHTLEEWDRLMDTNVKAAFLAAREVVPMMIEQGGGCILNTGSISGLVGLPLQGAYGPTKGAIHQLTRQMAIDYAAQGIRVNAIALGTIDTAIVQESARQSGDPAAFVEGLRSQHPIGRIASSDEVAKFVTFLASDYATFFTGAILSMDGGYTAR